MVEFWEQPLIVAAAASFAAAVVSELVRLWTGRPESQARVVAMNERVVRSEGQERPLLQAMLYKAMLAQYPWRRSWPVVLNAGLWLVVGVSLAVLSLESPILLRFALTTWAALAIVLAASRINELTEGLHAAEGTAKRVLRRKLVESVAHYVDSQDAVVQRINAADPPGVIGIKWNRYVRTHPDFHRWFRRVSPFLIVAVFVIAIAALLAMAAT